MIVVRPDAIEVPEGRFRKDFPQKRIDEYEESIFTIRLLHPISLERDSVLDTLTLRAGECRLRAIKQGFAKGRSFKFGDQVFSDTIPCIDITDLSELERLEIEVRENLDRMDFGWKERSAAITALHELRKRVNPEQTIKATTDEVVGKTSTSNEQTRVAEALMIQKHIHIAEVAGAKDAKAALKAIEKITTAGHRAKLAAAQLGQRTPHTLLKGDALAILSTLPAKKYDVIVTDPPYGVGADSFGSMAATGHNYDDSKKFFERFCATFPDESARITKDAAHAYIFCDQRQFERLSTLMLLAGWTVFPTLLVWNKGNGMLPFPDHGPRRTYECILYAWKGDRHTLCVKSDVIDIPSVRELKHGAQKPVALYRELLSRSANPGDEVIDCFGGSGPILVAANLSNLRATYIELEDSNFDIATLRANVKEIDDGAIERDGLEDIPLRG